MPLISSRRGGFALVCVNGCVPPDTTKGFDVLAKHPQNYELWPGAEVVAPLQVATALENPQLSPQPPPAPVQTTMRPAIGWNALTVVEPVQIGQPAMIAQVEPITDAVPPWWRRLSNSLGRRAATANAARKPTTTSTTTPVKAATPPVPPKAGS